MAKSKALELSIKIAGKVDSSLAAAVNRTNSQLGSLVKGIGDVGKAGLAAIGTMTAATAAAIAKCTDRAAELKNEMSDARRYVGGMEDEFGNIDTEKLKVLTDYIQDLSTMMPRTTGEISAMSAALGQSGKGFEEQINTSILRDTVLAATAMDLDDQTAGNYMAKWEAAFKMSHAEVMDLFDVINYLGANNATTAAEIAESVNRSGSVGQLAGVKPEVTAAFVTAMQASGVESDRVGTSMQRVYTNIMKGTSATKAQKDMWKTIGFTAEGVAKSMLNDGAGTLQKVFAAVKELPEEKQLAALNTLFNQWALEGGAKIANNLELLEKVMGEVNNGKWRGSMEKEFAVETDTPKAIKEMKENARIALEQDIGESFSEPLKNYNLAMTDLYNTVRKDMPQISELTGKAGDLAAKGIDKLTAAFENALPLVSKALDYLNNHGKETIDTVLKMTAAFGAMSVTPTIYRLLSGGNAALPGDGKNGSKTNILGLLFGAGQNFLSDGISAVSAGLDAAEIAKDFGQANGIENFLAGAFGFLKNRNGMNSKSLGQREAAWHSMNVITSAVRNNGIFGAVGNKVMDSGIGMIIGKMLSTEASDAANLAGVAFPLLEGFASIVSGALPVVGVLSAVIAVVSLFSDKLELLRAPIQKVFGESGVKVFDKFTTGLGNVKAGFWELCNGKTAEALEPMRQKIESVFGEKAADAFGGVTIILQSIMSVAGRLVNFSVNTVKPIISDVVSFITGTAIPAVLDTITASAPYIANIIGFIGNAVMTAAEWIGNAVRAVSPYVGGLIRLILNVAQTVIPRLLRSVSVAVDFLQAAVTAAGVILEDKFGRIGEFIAISTDGIKQSLHGITEFINGVFALDWERAWTGITEIFSGIFGTLKELAIKQLNSVSDTINQLIDKVNTVGSKIPGVNLNIPTIPMLAKGGFTNGVSIAGEAGREAVISFDSSVRRRNLDIWERAGKLLGIEPIELTDFSKGGSSESFVFSPQIVIQGGGADTAAIEAAIEAALEKAKAKFETWYKEMMRKKRRTAY